MDFSHSDKVRDLQQRVGAFMDKFIYPAESRFHDELGKNRRGGNPWQASRVMEELKNQARAEQLWNLFLPQSAHGAGLTTLEYIIGAAVILVVLAAAVTVWNNGLADKINQLVSQLMGTS